jgi:hypothetical protein
LRALEGRSNLDSNVVNLIDSKNLSNLTSKTLWDKQDYFNQYQQSFTKGEYNTKETVYTPTGQVVRSYMSGGIKIMPERIVSSSSPLNKTTNLITTIAANGSSAISAEKLTAMIVATVVAVGLLTIKIEDASLKQPVSVADVSKSTPTVLPTPAASVSLDRSASQDHNSAQESRGEAKEPALRSAKDLVQEYPSVVCYGQSSTESFNRSIDELILKMKNEGRIRPGYTKFADALIKRMKERGVTIIVFNNINDWAKHTGQAIDPGNLNLRGHSPATCRKNKDKVRIEAYGGTLDITIFGHEFVHVLQPDEHEIAEGSVLPSGRGLVTFNEWAVEDYIKFVESLKKDTELSKLFDEFLDSYFIEGMEHGSANLEIFAYIYHTLIGPGYRKDFPEDAHWKRFTREKRGWEWRQNLQKILDRISDFPPEAKKVLREYYFKMGLPLTQEGAKIIGADERNYPGLIAGPSSVSKVKSVTASSAVKAVAVHSAGNPTLENFNQRMLAGMQKYKNIMGHDLDIGPITKSLIYNVLPVVRGENTTVYYPAVGFDIAGVISGTDATNFVFTDLTREFMGKHDVDNFSAIAEQIEAMGGEITFQAVPEGKQDGRAEIRFNLVNSEGVLKEKKVIYYTGVNAKEFIPKEIKESGCDILWFATPNLVLSWANMQMELFGLLKEGGFVVFGNSGWAYDASVRDFYEHRINPGFEFRSEWIFEVAGLSGSILAKKNTKFKSKFRLAEITSSIFISEAKKRNMHIKPSDAELYIILTEVVAERKNVVDAVKEYLDNIEVLTHQDKQVKGEVPKLASSAVGENKAKIFTDLNNQEYAIKLFSKVERRSKNSISAGWIDEYLKDNVKEINCLQTSDVAEEDLPYSVAMRVPRNLDFVPKSLSTVPFIQNVRLPSEDVFLISRDMNGSAGVVKLGFLKDGRPVALKAYFTDRPLTERFMLMDYQGAYIADALGIGPKVHGLFVDQKAKWLVMDIVSGDFPSVVRENIKLVTYRDLKEIKLRLQNANINAMEGDFQYYITPQGRIQIIDQGALAETEGYNPQRYCRQLVNILTWAFQEVRQEIILDIIVNEPEVIDGLASDLDRPLSYVNQLTKERAELKKQLSVLWIESSMDVDVDENDSVDIASSAVSFKDNDVRKKLFEYTKEKRLDKAFEMLLDLYKNAKDPEIFTLFQRSINSSDSQLRRYAIAPFYEAIKDKRKEVSFDLDVLFDQGYLETNIGGMPFLFILRDSGAINLPYPSGQARGFSVETYHRFGKEYKDCALVGYCQFSIGTHMDLDSGYLTAKATSAFSSMNAKLLQVNAKTKEFLDRTGLIGEKDSDNFFRIKSRELKRISGDHAAVYLLSDYRDNWHLASFMFASMLGIAVKLKVKRFRLTGVGWEGSKFYSKFINTSFGKSEISFNVPKDINLVPFDGKNGAGRFEIKLGEKIEFNAIVPVGIAPVLLQGNVGSSAINQASENAVKNSFLKKELIDYWQMFAKIVNPQEKDLVVAAGASGADVSGVLFATNFSKAYFIDNLQVTLDKLIAEHGSWGKLELFRSCLTTKFSKGFTDITELERYGIESLIMLELEALGVRKEDVGCVLDERRRPKLTFKLPGEEKTREIIFVKQNLREESLELNNELRGKIDVYFERASLGLPYFYDVIIKSAKTWLKDNGFILVDSHTTYDENVSMRQFDGFGLKEVIVEEIKAKAAYILNKVMRNKYGWKFSLWQKKDQVANRTENKSIGGIDFRSLPIVTQATSNLGLSTMSQELKIRLMNFNLRSELNEIERLTSIGIVPSTQRIKEYIQASSISADNSPEDTQKLLSCIAEILRKQEEECCATDPTLKDILVVLESGLS